MHSGKTRWIAVTTSIAFAFAGFAVLHHEVEQRHELCAEHGERIHVSVKDLDQAPTPDSVAPSPEAEHEHCGVAWSGPQTGTDASIGIASGTCTLDSSARPAARADCFANLYRLAPKTSPPVVLLS